MMLHAHAWLKLCPSIKNKFVWHAMSFDPHSTPSLLISTLSSSTSLALSGCCSTLFQPRACADPHGVGGDGFTESDPLAGYEPKMVGDKTVIDIFNPIVTEQEGAHSTENQELY